MLISLTGCGRTVLKSHEWHTSPEHWPQSRIYHTPFQSEFASRIKLDQAPWPGNQAGIRSPNQAYRFWTGPVHQSVNGWWSTTIYVDHERDHALTIQIIDHNQWNVQAAWINEKLLYVSVWWGRIVGSYFIVDVEREKIIFKEMMHDGHIAYQQFRNAAAQ